MHMQCPRCAVPLPAGASFCLQCGQPLGATAGPARKRAWIAAAGIAAVLATAALLLQATGVLQAFGRVDPRASLRAEGSNSSEMLQAEGSRSSGMLRAEGSQNPAPLARSAERKIMPADIRAWLEHLERIERRRGNLAMDQLSAAVITLTELQLGGSFDALQSLLGAEDGADPVSPADEAKRDFDGYKQEWRSLEDDFRSVPPPGECVPIRESYDVALGETGNMILEIVDQIRNAETDRKGALRALTDMKGTSEQRIGRPSRETDGLVQSICRKYDTDPWFSISSDFGSGAFGKLGF